MKSNRLPEFLLFLDLVAALAAAAPNLALAAELRCKANADGNAVPISASGKALGEYYFADRDSCRAAIASAASGVICTSGENESAIPFSLEIGKEIGGYYFSDQADCFRAVTTAAKGVICTGGNQNGYSSVFNLRSQAEVGPNYFENIETCVSAARNATGDYVCSPVDNGAFAAFHLSNGARVPKTTFGEMGGCIAKTRTLAQSDEREMAEFAAKAAAAKPSPSPSPSPSPAVAVPAVVKPNPAPLPTSGSSSLLPSSIASLLNYFHSFGGSDAPSTAAPKAGENHPAPVVVARAAVAPPPSLPPEVPHKWGGPKGTDCEEFPGDGGAAKVVEPSKCFSKKLTFFQWEDAASEKCVAYNACNQYVGKMDPALCRGIPNHFAEERPSLGFTWQNCLNASSGTTIPFTDKGRFRPECAPDTLYSWRRADFVKSYEDHHTLHRLLDLHGRELYTWRTPIGSFGYGQQSIRLKLKPDVKYVWINSDDRNCSTLAQSYDISKSVFVVLVTTISSYSEYVLCSDSPIESWSTDTEPHRQEMLLERDWIKNHVGDKSTTSFDALWGDNNYNSCPWHYEQHWDNGASSVVPDWGFNALAKNLQSVQIKLASDQDKIYFTNRPDIVPSLWNHFATRTPGYFNNRDSKIQETWPDRDPEGCDEKKGK